MAHFSKEFIAQIKLKLSEEEARVSHELEQITSKKARAGQSQTAFPNLGDKDDENAAEVAVYSDNLTIEKELEKALRDIQSTLLRLEKDNDYGICKYCSK